jgi:hypothetical protein
MRTLSKIFSVIFLILALVGMGVFGHSMDSGSLRIDYLILSAALLFVSMMLHKDSKQRP